MTQKFDSDSTFPSILRLTSLVTAVVAVLNALFSQWVLVIFFVVVALVTGALFLKLNRASHVDGQMSETGTSELVDGGESTPAE